MGNKLCFVKVFIVSSLQRTLTTRLTTHLLDILSLYRRIDEAILPPNQYMQMFVSSSSFDSTVSGTWPQSDQALNFSTIQAARPVAQVKQHRDLYIAVIEDRHG